MKRRTAFKSLSLAAGGLFTLPAWANGWRRSSLSFSPFLSPQQQDLLVSLVDTLIPTTDIPGAKDLDVPLFVQKMITDCYEPEVQKSLAQGLQMIEHTARESYQASFIDCQTIDREIILTKLDNPLNTELPPKSKEPDANPHHDFFQLVKELTIRGYMTSEYVMTHHTDYTMVPGHFSGCVPATSQSE